MNHVIFLDIDGVINNSKTPTLQKGDNIFIMADPYCVFLINRLVDRTGCKVVLSSSWRHDPEWRKNMKAQGLVFEFLDRTPRHGKETERGYQIQSWLDNHQEVTKYAIVDDYNDMLESQQPNFFETSWQTGITEDIALAIEKHLTDLT